MVGGRSYNVKCQARTLASQLGESEKNRFMVGTSTIRDTNQIHIVEMNEDTSDVSCAAILEHPQEIWHLSPSPHDPDLLFTTHNTGNSFGCTLWRLPDLGLDTALMGESDPALAPLASVPVSSQRVHSMLWSPLAESGKTVSVEHRSLTVWAIDGASDSVQESSKIWCEGRDPLNFGCWDPHHPHSILTAMGNTMSLWDLRSSKETTNVPNVHHSRVNSADFNPNRPHFLVTGGDDYAVKFWDLRKPTAPIKTLLGHSHWVTCVQYNRFHDQLVLSAGTDNVVCLWHIATISSAPIDELGGEDSVGGKPIEDTLAVKSRDHEDSVYATAWSACDGWAYATLSFDGKLCINSVPPDEKFKILL